MVYITGDTHGDGSRLSATALRRLRKGDTLMVCGDFGFVWDNSPAEQKQLDKLARRKYTVAFVDGQHENFDLINAYPTEEWNGGRVHVIRPNVLHLMRGEIFTVEGHTYFVFGGGESDDKEFRVPGVSWWASESPSPEEQRHALDNLSAHGNRVDYVLSHVPSGQLASRWRIRSDSASLFLNRLEETVTCRHWFFGSLHQDKPFGSQKTCVFNALIPLSEEKR